MEDVLASLYNICGTDLLPVAVPILIYLLYRSRKIQHDLQGKVVLITGASSGLGEAVAHSFYKAGCKLILAARRVDELRRVREELRKIKTDNQTYEPVVLPLDLAEIETIPKTAAKAVAVYSCIDILINNAGISFRGNILETSLEVQMKLMTVNYFGQIALTKALLPSLIKSKGHVVTVSSVQGFIALPQRSAYSASKHALQAFMDCLRTEIPEIKVTVISPGYIKTNLSINAVTGSGEKYGVVDASTSSGYTPEYVAQKIFESVALDKKDVIVAPLGPKIAILLRILTPSLFFYVIKMWAKRKK